MISSCRCGLRLLLCLLLLCLGACHSSPHLSLPACQDPLGCVTLGPQEPLKLAALVPMSGEIDAAWAPRLQVFDLALQERDQQFLGHPIRMQVLDDACEQEQGTQAALQILAEPQVVAVLNASCSASAQVISPLLSRSGLVMISSSNTASSLTGLSTDPGEDWYPGYFRTAHNDAYTGEAAAIATLTQLRVQSAAVIHTGDIYTEGLANAFSQSLIERGGEIVLSQRLRPGESDLIPILEQVVEQEARLLAFFLYRPQGDALLRQQAQVEGMEQITLLTADSLAQATFIEALGEYTQGLLFAVPRINTGQAVSRLRRRFQEELGLDPSDIFYPQAYDAVGLFFHALEQITQQADDGSIQIGRQALREALYNTTDFTGVTGTLSCTSLGDCGATQINMIQVDDPTLEMDQIWDNVIYTYSPNF